MTTMVIGCEVNLEEWQIIEAEVWGLYFRLQLAIEKGISKLIIEMDFAPAVLLMNQSMQDTFILSLRF